MLMHIWFDRDEFKICYFYPHIARGGFYMTTYAVMCLLNQVRKCHNIINVNAYFLFSDFKV